MFVIYFLIKVEITLLNNVNLTDCFTSTLRPNRILSRLVAPASQREVDEIDYACRYIVINSQTHLLSYYYTTGEESILFGIKLYMDRLSSTVQIF